MRLKDKLYKIYQKDTEKPRITICVLLYENFFNLAEKSVGSIIKHLDKKYYTLFVGMNECSEKTKKYIRRLKEVDRIFEEPQNIGRTKIMEKMFRFIDTEFIWWFDDDCYVTHPDALIDRLLAMDSNKNNDKLILLGNVISLGIKSKLSLLQPSVNEWCKKQKWYTGKKEPCGIFKYTKNYYDREDKEYCFPSGDNWFAKTSFIKSMNYPSNIPAYSDIILSFMIRQTGNEFQHIGYCGTSPIPVLSRKKLKK